MLATRKRYLMRMTYLEAEDHENDHDTSGEFGALVGLRGKADKTNNEEDGRYGSQTNNVNWSSTKACHDPPGNEAP